MPNKQMGLFNHQRLSIQAAQDRKYYALFLECGLGKTRVALELIKHYRSKTLIVAPNTALENWGEEIVKWAPELSHVILKGSKEKRVKLLKASRDIYLINYEALRLLITELGQANFFLVISDESQKLKSYKSQQSKAAFKIAQCIPYKLIMTGTPITNNPLDIFGQYRFLNPFIFGFSYFKFRNSYAIMGGYMNYQVMKWINMDELSTKVYKCAIRFTKEECLDLPEKLYNIVNVELTQEQRRVYERLKKDFVAEFKQGIISAPLALTRLLRFSQITAGFCKDEDGREVDFDKNPKMIWLKEFMEELSKDKKVIVFVRFLKEIEMTKKVLEELHINGVVVCGAVKGEDRQIAINLFNEDAEKRVFIGQIDTAGMAINLTAAHYVIFLTNSYNYGTRIQCEDRAHRIGQDKNVTYIDVIANKSIDETMLKCIKGKESLADHIISKKVIDII